MRQFCAKCNKIVESVANAKDRSKSCALCGARLTHDRIPEGTIIGGYMVEGEINRVPTGVVYRCRHLNLERLVAMRVLSEELCRNFDFVDRFFNEARGAAELNHPNILQSYEAGATPEGINYIAMELFEGEQLSTRLSREGLIPQKVAIGVAMEVSRAFAHASRRGIHHGTFSPESVILNSSGHAKVVGIGIAKDVAGELAEGGTAILYAAPELRKNGNASDDKTDMYAFGATLYHMLGGTPPHGLEQAEAASRQEPPPLAKSRPGLGSPICELVDAMLKPDPGGRPSGWDEIVERLERTEVEVTGSLRLSEQKRDSAAAKRRDPMMVAVLSLLGLAALLALMTIFFLLGAKRGAVTKPETAAVPSSPSAQAYHSAKLAAVESLLDPYNLPERALAVKFLMGEWEGADDGWQANRQLVPAIATAREAQLAAVRSEVIQGFFQEYFYRLMAEITAKPIDKMSAAELYRLDARLGIVENFLGRHSEIADSLTERQRGLLRSYRGMIDQLVSEME